MVRGNRKKYARFIKEGLGGETALEIYQQRFVGGKDFAERIRKRIELRERPGSRASAAEDILAEQERQRQEREAERLLKAVAKYYNVNLSTLRLLLYARGAEGKARNILAALLRERLTWTCRKISEYIGLKGSVERYLMKIGEDSDLLKDFEKNKSVNFGIV